MTERQYHTVAYMMLQHPQDNALPPGTAETIDYNTSLGRMRNRPWCRNSAPTLVGSTRLFVRVHTGGGNWTHRILSGVEAMALIGWSPEYFASIRDEENSVLLSLAGNAYSGFAVLPLLVCMFSVYSPFAPNGAPEPQLAISIDGSQTGDSSFGDSLQDTLD